MNAARILLLLLLCGSAATAAEFASKDGKFRITVPDEWNPRDRGASEDPRVVILIAFTAPGQPATYVRVTNLHGGALTERGQAFSDADGPNRRKRGYLKVQTDPVVHLTEHDGDDERTRFDAIFYRLIRGTVFSIQFATDAGTYDNNLEKMIAVSRSLVADIPTQPAVPEGYRQTKSNGFLILHPKSLKGKSTRIRKELAKGIKRFTAVHGKLPNPRTALPQIVVLNTYLQRGDFGAAIDDTDFEADEPRQRMFCVRLGKDASARRVAWFHRELYQLLFALTYGSREPIWLAKGLSVLEQSRVATGKRAPMIADYIQMKMPKVIVRFDKINTVARTDWDAYIDQGGVYAALFHAGPKQYRMALKDFLADLRETGDWRAAEQSHILTFDQEKLREDAQKFMRKLTPVKPK